MDAERVKKIKSFFKDEANLFVIKMVLIYVGWKAIHQYFLIGGPPSVVTWWTNFVYWLGSQYATATSFILNHIFREHTIPIGVNIYYPEELKYVIAAEHCLAIPATVIFIGSILLYRGSWLNKLWFIPMGVIIVSLINLLRLIFVCETFIHFRKTIFTINHSFVYVAITYALIMVLIIWWMQRFGRPQRAPVKEVKTDKFTMN